jgi:hypothetical protein
MFSPDEHAVAEGGSIVSQLSPSDMVHLMLTSTSQAPCSKVGPAVVGDVAGGATGASVSAGIGALVLLDAGLAVGV